MRLCQEQSFRELVDNAALEFGLELRDGPPQLGDIIMIGSNIGNPWRALGIAMPPFVVALAMRGLLYTRVEPLAVWRL